MEKILFDYLAHHIDLSDDEKQIIRDLSLIQSFKKGTILLEEGKKSKDFYFVLKGCLRRYYLKDGVQRTTEFYTELESLTPVCIIDGSPSAYTISCEEDTVLLIGNEKNNAEAFARFPRFESLCRVMSEQLAAKTKTEFDEFKNSTPEERYLSLVENRPALLQRVPQHQLASYLGLTPQSLSRLRKRLIQK
ncbi:Crp/Fnr family transcriptional regulator [Flavobacterium caeni]|uniref:cAMP-binding domain of CRP or a regulatory subunit of cAMP-dependent protein kinases n=1 Tax=Flavobacterium caeni TaxID=490189 RepID=A0A1G5FCG3_9FLAO|nr:Crp/Fnr family transcriptional regulator [Flavobacterium caeni]SCY36867.1 cAMP-binding domain of CRP or a regulatory subunit of cAMP-dependent protein kinases [Flavobacterium caeni]